MSSGSFWFLEQNDFSVRLARTSRDRPLHIEELREVPITDAATAVSSIPAGAEVSYALRPKSASAHLATAEESKRHPDLAGVRQFLREASPGGPLQSFTLVQADNGHTPPQGAWFLQACLAKEFHDSLASLKPLQPTRHYSATLATIGAVATTVTQTILLLDLGESSSHALLVGPQGVLAVKTVSVNLDVIAETVQTALSLKFRGSAAKLFFNADYDFSDTSAGIAAAVAAILKPEIESLLANHPAPAALCCTTLPAGQQWFVSALGAALELATLEAPDLQHWASTAGVSFASPELEAHLSPAWFGLISSLHALAAGGANPVAWHAQWLPQETAPAVAPKPASPVAAKPTPAAAPVAKPAPKPAENQPASKPAPQPSATPPPTPVPAPVAAVVTPPVPAKPEKPAPSSLDYPPKPSVNRSPNDPVRAKKNLPVLVGAIALVLALLGGGVWYLQAQKAEAARLAMEQKNTELRLQAEAERARLSEEKARLEAESRRKFEFEAAQKISAAETARAQAELEARNQLAARLANARGSLVITTVPENATVTIGDLPPLPSPATFRHLPIGRHAVSVTLPQYDPVSFEVEINENATTSPEPITLTRLVGSLEVATTPAGTAYEIRPAGGFSLNLANHAGQTPAKIENLDTGDYTVTFSRPGWPAHTEKVTVARNATTNVAWTFHDGSVQLTSAPSGASVTRDGVQIGKTPLTLNLPPGAVQFELGMDGFDPVVVSGRVEAGSTRALSAQFPESHRIYPVEQVDRRPEAIKSVKPDLPYYLTLANGRVEIQAVVTSDGEIRDAKVLRTTEADLRKYCLDALANWKFKPGVKDGKPVNTRMTIPFVITKS